MKVFLLIASAIVMSSCSRNLSQNQNRLNVSPFGKPFIGVWKGKGRIFLKPEINCDSVSTQISLLLTDPNQIRISNTEITCGDQTYHFADRTLTVDYKSESTYENGVKVGQAQGYKSDYYGRWFTFKVDLPEFGSGPYYMTLNVSAPGTFKDVQGPMLDLDISANENGSHTGFVSHLYPRENARSHLAKVKPHSN
jgi:hypothetical protein